MRQRHFILLIPLLAGCYEYNRVEAAAPLPPGQELRLTLTDAGTADLAAQLGPSTESVAGRLLPGSADAYVLAVSDTHNRNGIDVDWRGEQVAINKSLVAVAQRRQFSRPRTAVLGVGVVAAIALARTLFWGNGATFGGAPPGGGPPPK